MVAQLLVTEGFENIEEVAFVELDELSSIEGFDEDTAVELQARAKEHLEKVAAELDAKRKELGVEDDLVELEGVTGPMAVRFGEKEVKTLEDLAGLTPDDLRGWFETRDGERVREEGILEGFNMSAEDAEEMILLARLRAGWISQEDYDEARAPSSIEELDEESRAEAESLLAAEELLKDDDQAGAS
jgi:N utilization substance protein A